MSLSLSLSLDSNSSLSLSLSLSFWLRGFVSLLLIVVSVCELQDDADTYPLQDLVSLLVNYRPPLADAVVLSVILLQMKWSVGGKA